MTDRIYQLTKYVSGNATFDRWQDYVISILNPFLSRPPPSATGLTPTGVTAGTYGDSTHVGRFAVNEFGQLTGASSVPISFPTPPSSGIPLLSATTTYFADDMYGKNLGPTWNVSASSEGAFDSPVSGIRGISTNGTAANVAYYDWNTHPCFIANQAGLVFTWKALGGVSNGASKSKIGLADSGALAGHYVTFAATRGAGNHWTLEIFDGLGTTTYVPTVSVSVDGYHTFEMDMTSLVTPIFKIDGVNIGPFTPSLPSSPIGSGSYGPILWLQTTGSDTLKLDYFQINGTRPT